MAACSPSASSWYNPLLGDREECIRRELKTVRKMAMKYKSICQVKGIAIEDLISEGTVALLIAYERFSPSKASVKFSSYAYLYIKGQMLDYIQASSLIRIPDAPNLVVSKIFKAGLENDPPEKISKTLGITPEAASKALKINRIGSVGSLNQIVKDSREDEGLELIQLISSDVDNTESDVREFISILNTLEKRILWMLMNGTKARELNRKMRLPPDRINEHLYTLLHKANEFFELNKSDEVIAMKAPDISRKQYEELKSKGLSDAQIAKQLKVGKSTLHNRKKSWNLVEIKAADEPKANTIPVQSEVNDRKGNYSELAAKVEHLENENKLLWEMVRLLKNFNIESDPAK